MSRSTYDLIGEIINPAPRTAAPRAARVATPNEPVDVLIGRIIHPAGRPVAPLRAEPIVAAPPVGAEPTVPPLPAE